MQKVKYFILLVLLIIVVFECYQYFDSGGNVIIFLQNQSGYKNENVDYTIMINDRMLFEGVFDGNETTPMWPMVEGCFGRNTLQVSSKTRNVKLTRKFGDYR
jgi:hypothetical protein